MKKQTEAIIKGFETTLDGQPWFGRSIYSLLEEVDTKKVHIKPNGTEHSLAELLYHMITWADFTLKRMEKDMEHDLAEAEKLDWREINPKVHTWRKGVSEFKSLHKKIIALLKKKDDDALGEMVDFRKYNYRFLLNGLIEHNIYHIGQIAYLNKIL